MPPAVVVRPGSICRHIEPGTFGERADVVGEVAAQAPRSGKAKVQPEVAGEPHRDPPTGAANPQGRYHSLIIPCWDMLSDTKIIAITAAMFAVPGTRPARFAVMRSQWQTMLPLAGEEVMVCHRPS